MMDELDAEEAVAAYREALNNWTGEGPRRDWAAAQYNLGVALMSLGDLERLAEAVAAFDEVLKVWTRASAPENWAATLHHRAIALYELAMHGDRGTLAVDRLCQAVDAVGELREYKATKLYCWPFAACLRRMGCRIL